MEGEWTKRKGKVVPEVIEEGLHSRSEKVVERAGRVLAACEEKNLAMYAETRLLDDAIPSYTCLYDYLPKRVEDSDAENWLRIIRRGFMGNRYMVSATLNYILSVELDNIPQRIKDTLISMVEKSFVEWIRRLRHLDWVSASERKEMLKKCLTSENDRVLDGAMACWLNEEGRFL